MRKALMAAALMAALGFARSARADEIKWLTNYDEAVKQAKAEKKSILVDFTGSDWCPWCIKLHNEVFSQKDFETWAAKNVVLLELDFPRKTQLPDDLKKQNNDLLKKYKIKGFPTVLFLDTDGNVKGKSGYMQGGPAAWTAKADELLAQPGQPADAPKADAKKGDSLWGDSWDKAAATAKDQKRLILADFTGSDWCPWCIKLRKEVFDTDDFKKWAKDHAVLLEVDFPREKEQSDEVKAQNKKLQEKYSIEGYPTVVFMNADGKKVGEMGYEEGGASNWIKKAQDILDANK
jgi:protein disulfide-isomerase